MNGKGDKRRPPRIGKHEEDLRWALAMGLITFKHYENRYNELLHEGKITRDGRKVTDG